MIRRKLKAKGIREDVWSLLDDHLGDKAPGFWVTLRTGPLGGFGERLI